LAHETICCTDCGREFETAQEHFVPKCVLQHRLRTRIVSMQYVLNMFQRELELLEMVVNENCSHCKEVKED
jgi:hypothetical protein